MEKQEEVQEAEAVQAVITPTVKGEKELMAILK